MGLLDLTPVKFDIKACSGDDVRLFVEVADGAGCTSNISIANVTFAANMVANNTNYPAAIVKDVANSTVTATWTGNVTAGVGPGSYKWFMTFTDNLTRTKLNGNFVLVSRTA